MCMPKIPCPTFGRVGTDLPTFTNFSYFVRFLNPNTKLRIFWLNYEFWKFCEKNLKTGPNPLARPPFRDMTFPETLSRMRKSFQKLKDGGHMPRQNENETKSWLRKSYRWAADGHMDRCERDFTFIDRSRRNKKRVCCLVCRQDLDYIGHNLRRWSWTNNCSSALFDARDRQVNHFGMNCSKQSLLPLTIRNRKV